MSSFAQYRERDVSDDDDDDDDHDQVKSPFAKEAADSDEKQDHSEEDHDHDEQGSEDEEEVEEEEEEATDGQNAEGSTEQAGGESSGNAAAAAAAAAAKKQPAVKKAIGRMTVKEIREELKRLAINGKGNREEIEARLRKARKALKSGKQRSKKTREQPFDYYLIFDVEATCVQDRAFNFPNEIIEFPVVMLNSRTLEFEDEFHSYVKPVVNPILSEFCTTLTGIQQSTVDNSPTFPEVLQKFEVWLEKHQLFTVKTAVFLTDGPWDIRDFITKQLAHSSLRRPRYFYKWINLRRIFQDYYGLKEKVKLNMMLEFQGMTFEGREHSGISDARNIGRIARQLILDGCTLNINDGMNWGR